MADTISSLPDGLICHILSFLPTKLVVATSVLSKRWYPLWRSVSTLDFDDDNTRDQEASLRFNEFVYSVLLSIDLRQPIKRFRLMCHQNCNPNVSKWVNTVLQRDGVENLDLRISRPGLPWELLNLQSGIFSCRTLVVLRLSGFCVNNVSSVGFPSLKTLHLHYLRFPEYRYFKELLSACPNLEDLRGQFLHPKNLDLVASGEFKSFASFARLIRAEIHVVFLKFPLKAISNVEFLKVTVFKEFLDFNVIPTFNNLTHLEIGFHTYDWHLLGEVLQHCPKLQKLEIYKIEKPHNEIWVPPKFVPQCVSLQLGTCCLKTYRGMDCELQFARYVMQNAGALLSMEIYSCLDSDLEKFAMIKNLSLCERRSAKCQLSFH